MGIFGGLWWFAGLQLQHAVTPLPYALDGLLTLILVVACLRLRRRASRAAVPDAVANRKISRAFLWINVVQWAVIFAAAQVLGALHRMDWLYATVIAIVGLHFLPLARLFRYPPHLPTGLGLLAWALLFPWLLQDSGGPLSAGGPFGAGLVLWAATAWIIWQQRGWLAGR